MAWSTSRKERWLLLRRLQEATRLLAFPRRRRRRRKRRQKRHRKRQKRPRKNSKPNRQRPRRKSWKPRRLLRPWLRSPGRPRRAETSTTRHWTGSWRTWRFFSPRILTRSTPATASIGPRCTGQRPTTAAGRSWRGCCGPRLKWMPATRTAPRRCTLRCSTASRPRPGRSSPPGRTRTRRLTQAPTEARRRRWILRRKETVRSWWRCCPVADKEA
mmetsp:Transcript_10783/g.20271  ORF Transcript_10783/g.20271 Transcript_10783/m.20271 type:complete len:215 (-) Transcript_10783:10-654(-)